MKISNELTYEFEKMNDTVLNEIKIICFRYLDNPRNVDKYSDDELFVAYDFLEKQYVETKNIKDAFELKTYAWPHIEIAQHLDTITVGEDAVTKKTTQIKHIDLTKDVNNLLETIGFCHGVIGKIIEERNN